MPPLDVFKEKIDFYQNLAKEIDAHKTAVIFDWLKIDAQPLKVVTSSYFNGLL